MDTNKIDALADRLDALRNLQQQVVVLLGLGGMRTHEQLFSVVRSRFEERDLTAVEEFLLALRIIRVVEGGQFAIVQE